MHLRRIFHTPGAISVHGGFSPGEPRTRALWTGAEDSTDLAIGAQCVFLEIFQLFSDSNESSYMKF